MSRKYNPYVHYTEYYLISGAYQVINVVNEILTYSASYSDNIKEYLRNKVESKQVALNELIHNRSENDARVNGNTNPDNDLDEDGFVVIKMRRPKKNKNEFHDSNNDNKNDNIHGNGSASAIHANINMDQNVSLKCNIHNDIVKQIVDNMIKDVVEKLSKNYKAN
jgi:hypothetical protein